MRRIILALIFHFACLMGLSLFVSCGESEDVEIDDLSTDIYDLDIDELLALDVPADWALTQDIELRSQYFAAQILQQYGNTPASQIIAEHYRKRELGRSSTFSESIAFAKAQYVLWPNEHNRRYLQKLLETQLINETDDPELFVRLYRKHLIEQHGDIPEVHTVVEYEQKLRLKNVPLTDDEIITAYEAKYVLSPNETVLRQLQKYRKAKAEGTPFHLIDWDGDDE